MQLEPVQDRHTIARLIRQARSLRLESNRASPTLARQFIALAEVYETRLAEAAAPPA